MVLLDTHPECRKKHVRREVYLCGQGTKNSWTGCRLARENEIAAVELSKRCIISRIHYPYMRAVKKPHRDLLGLTSGSPTSSCSNGDGDFVFPHKG